MESSRYLYESYLLLNKDSDFRADGGFFCSGLLDSGRKQTEWSRACVRRSEGDDSLFRVRVYVSDQEKISVRGECRGLREFVRTEDISMSEKLAIYAPYLARDMEDELDCLLDGVRGRYVWIVAESVGFPEIWIYFETRSWLSYLPEIYGGQGEDSFLFRYLSIFQWIYSDMSRRISELPHMLYPSFANRQTLEWLASWLGMEDVGIWNDRQLVWLVENARRLSMVRGTKRYMEEMVWLFTGQVPFIVEYDQTQCYKTDLAKARRLEELYGENASVVTVVLPCGAVEGRDEVAALRQIIRSSAPAYAECRMVLLSPYIFLDRYAFVGINSCLGGPRQVALNGESLLPYRSVMK